MDIENIIAEHAHHFLQQVKVECIGEKEAIVIIRKYVKDGQINTEEEVILKRQLWDSLKIVGIGVPFVLLPGASVIVPILVKVAEKHNIKLMPSAFEN